MLKKHPKKGQTKTQKKKKINRIHHIGTEKPPPSKRIKL